jgi:hypothetical protein
MPKAQGLGKDVTRAMIADELDEEGSEPRDIAPTPVTPTYESPPPVHAAPPAAAAPFDMQAFAQILAGALAHGQAATAETIKGALAQATTMARAPIPENQVAPGISVYSHPDGDAAHPRTELRCPMYLGVYDEAGTAKAAFEYHADTLMELERVGLNRVAPGTYRVERNDNVIGVMQAVQHTDSLGQPTRMILAFPESWLATDQFHQLPSLKNVLSQVLEREPATAA